MSSAIRVGIVGCGYGREVLAPAFRADPRCSVVAIAATSQARAASTAQALGISRAFGDWRAMLDPTLIDAVAIAAPPAAQTEIAGAAIERKLPVFAEKPLAASVDEAAALHHAASTAGVANVIDFNFRAIDAFQQAQRFLAESAIGQLRHVTIIWQVENYANRARLQNWKTDTDRGGGALFNFVSHSFDYLEWLIGPIGGVFAHLAGMPNDVRRNDSFVAMAFRFANGVPGNLTMSAAAYQGSGHRLEFYGEDGTIVLDNPGPDYMRGFRLFVSRRPDRLLNAIDVTVPSLDEWSDGRVLPASRLAARFLDWIDGGPAAKPDFAAGLRVQILLDAARRSHAIGRWIDISDSGTVSER